MKVKLPRPFLGRLLITPVKENLNDVKKKQMDELVEQKLGIKAEERKIILAQGETDYNPETGRFDKFKLKEEIFLPYQRGKILAMASDAYGETYERKYGKDGAPYPVVGDVIYYIPGQAYKIDADGKYYYIADEDVMGFGEIEIEVNEINKDEVSNVR